MRIAPKPLPGQEISLERLLEDRDTKTQPKISGVSIIMDMAAMILKDVPMRNSVYEFQVRYEPLEPQNYAANFLGSATSAMEHDDFRSASSEEFYAILSAIVETAGQPDSPSYPAAQQALIKINNLWQNGPFRMFTRASFKGNIGLRDEIQHYPSTPVSQSCLGKLYGPEGPITALSDGADLCWMLFGDNDVPRVNRVLSELIPDEIPIYRTGIDEKLVSSLVVIGQDGIDLTGGLYTPTLIDGFHSIGIKKKWTGGLA